jgi:Rieske Fe-S protein
MLNPSEGEVTRRTAYIRYNGLLGTVPSFTTISNRCVHLGCPTQVAGIPLDEQAKEVKAEGSIPAHLIPTAGASGFNCPCHGGAYDTEGNRTAGPPVRALDRYQFEIDNGNLIVRNTFSVAYVVGEGKDAVMKVYEPAGPGIHVDGPEAWLYPVEGGDF